MKPDHIIDGLKDVAQQLGIQVRMEKGSFRGGRCTVAGDEIIVLNRHHIPEMQISVLAEGLRAEDVDRIYMKPSLRKALEEAWARSADAAGEAVDGDE